MTAELTRLQSFRARMPREDVVGLSGIGRRMEQARKEYLLIPWNKRKNSDKVTRDTMLKRQEQAGTQPPSPAESDHASSATHSHVKSKNSEGEIFHKDGHEIR